MEEMKQDLGTEYYSDAYSNAHAPFPFDIAICQYTLKLQQSKYPGKKFSDTISSLNFLYPEFLNLLYHTWLYSKHLKKRCVVSY